MKILIASLLLSFSAFAGTIGGAAQQGAIGYINRLNPQRVISVDNDSRTDLVRFVNGLDALGAWSSLVEAWIWRSQYNSGQNGTVYSFKGNDLTLNGYPTGFTWSDSGMTMVGANKYGYISGNLLPLSPGFTVMLSYNDSSDYNAGGYLGGRSNIGVAFGAYGNYRISDNYDQDCVTNLGYVSAGTSRCNFITVTGEQTASYYVNGSSGTGTAGGNNYSSMPRDTSTLVGGAGFNGGASNLAYAHLIFSSNLNSKAPQLFQLYKSTVGKNLVFP